MSMADLITGNFSSNHWVIQRQVDGLTHEDSLLQLPFRGNCLNWVLGHVVAGRCRALVMLGEERVWSEAEAASYETGSAAIDGGETVYRLERILAALEQSQQQLAEALKRVSEEELQQVRGERTVAQQLLGLAWHETYHVGQTEILRQLAGTDDKVV